LANIVSKPDEAYTLFQRSENVTDESAVVVCRQTAWRQHQDSTIAHAVLVGSAMELTAILQLRVLTTVTVTRTQSVRYLYQARRSLTSFCFSRS